MRKEHIAWNKNKKTSKETKELQRQAKLKNPVRYWLGKKRPYPSKETREKISLAKKGVKHSVEHNAKVKMNHAHFWLGKKKPQLETTKEKIRNFVVNHPNRVFKDTKPELQMEELLKRLEVEYQKQVPLFNIARVDFYVQSKNLVIQVDGCYWHGCPIHFPSQGWRRIKDINQDKILQENGLKVIRFWEHEINSHNFIIKDLINV